jgi:hypothetical protein
MNNVGRIGLGLVLGKLLFLCVFLGAFQLLELYSKIDWCPLSG